MVGTRQELGRFGEGLAAEHYEASGYAVVARNWRCKHGEIDLIVKRDRLVVFCEVKTRSSSRFGTPFEAVTAAKRARLRRLASAWLVETGGGHDEIRFDVAGVIGNDLEVIEAAF